MKSIIFSVLVVTASLFAAVPGPPTITAVTASTVTLKWNGLKTASFYTVYQSQTGGPRSVVAVTTTLSYIRTLPYSTNTDTFVVVPATFSGAGAVSTPVTAISSTP